MAFRKRNTLVNTVKSSGSSISLATDEVRQQLPGTRPSPLAAAVNVTSTGTRELDGFLGGHGGLVLGSSLLIGEHGATDYAGALLRAYAAEGLLQGHEIHFVGMDASWMHNLPGIVAENEASQEKVASTTNAKMKIAWRYDMDQKRSVERYNGVNLPFCHSYDLTKRLDNMLDHKVTYYPLTPGKTILLTILQRLQHNLDSKTATVHRILVPSFLSPAYYPLSVVKPAELLQFMHGLQAVLQRHYERATMMLNLPLSLYPRTSGLVKWIEQFSSGVIEMVPFPYLDDASTNEKDKAQGLLRILKLPLTTDRGEGGAGSGNTIGDDLAFTFSRKKFVIEPFSLPPVEGDQEAQKEAGKALAKDVEF